MQSVILKKPAVKPDGEIYFDELHLLLNLNSSMAIRLKRLGIDVHHVLDNEQSRNSIQALMTENEAVASAAKVIWPEIKDIEDWLDTDGLSMVREGLLAEIVNFTPSHSRQAILLMLSEMKEATEEIGQRVAENAKLVVKNLRQRALNSIPTGEEMLRSMKDQLDTYLARKPGGFTIEH